MQQSGGLLRQPVQKLVATLICIADANAPNLGTRTKNQKSQCDFWFFLLQAPTRTRCLLITMAAPGLTLAHIPALCEITAATVPWGITSYL